MKANHLRLALGFQVLFLVCIIRLITNLLTGMLCCGCSRVDAVQQEIGKIYTVCLSWWPCVMWYILHIYMQAYSGSNDKSVSVPIAL